MSDKPTRPERQSERASRADNYLDEHLEGQKDWYDRKATNNKKWHMWLGFLIIAAGAAVSVIQLWTPSPSDSLVHWTAVVTAILGATVVIAKGIDRLWSFDENWVTYRQACEGIKRERRLYLNAAGPYATLIDECAAYQIFVERVEDVIAAEQHTFWQTTREKVGGGVPPQGSATKPKETSSDIEK